MCIPLLNDSRFNDVNKVSQFIDELLDRQEVQAMQGPLKFGPDQQEAAGNALQAAQLAIVAFLSKDGNELIGPQMYLETFGVLQALFVQQDAVFQLEGFANRTRSDYLERYSILKDVREIRNRSIGHPAETRAIGKYKEVRTTKDGKRTVRVYKKKIKNANEYNMALPLLVGKEVMVVISSSDNDGNLSNLTKVRLVSDLILPQQQCIAEILDEKINGDMPSPDEFADNFVTELDW